MVNIFPSKIGSIFVYEVDENKNLQNGNRFIAYTLSNTLDIAAQSGASHGQTIE